MPSCRLTSLFHIYGIRAGSALHQTNTVAKKFVEQVQKYMNIESVNGKSVKM